MYRFDAIVHFRKAEQLHGKPQGHMFDLWLKAKKAELTATLNWIIWLQLWSHARFDLFCSLYTCSLSFWPKWSDLVILTLQRTVPPPSLYIESIKAKIHFIRSLQMYVKLDLSLRGLRLHLEHKCRTSHMTGSSCFIAVLLQRSQPQFLGLIKLPSGLGEFWIQSSLQQILQIPSAYTLVNV